jgi:hypothetical protein
MDQPMHHRSRPRLGQLPKRCNGNFMKNKNGKYIPFDGVAAYNPQRQEALRRALKAYCALQ